MTSPTAKGFIMIAAGGTGGHVFPARVLAKALQQSIVFVTDTRGLAWCDPNDCGQIICLPAATPYAANIIARAKAVIITAYAIILAWRRLLHARLKGSPCLLAIGFGGYPSFAPLIGARLAGIPILIHEQNVVIGRANRLLARRASAITCGFSVCRGLSKKSRTPEITGTPLRSTIEAYRGRPYPIINATTTFHLLICGGSQGARFMSDIIPAALAELQPEQRSRLRVTQQCRSEDLARVRRFYDQAKIHATLSHFFDDFGSHIAASHLIIARAGASTVNEIAAIGRPALFIPLPQSLDGDQNHNAKLLSDHGGGWILPQHDANAQQLVAFIEARMSNPDGLRNTAKAAADFAPRDPIGSLTARIETLITSPEISL